MQEIFGWPLDSRFAIATVAVGVSGFLRGFVGFGAALVSVPVVGLLYGPLIAVPAINLMGVPAVLLLLPDAIRFSERAIVVPASAAILAATPFGAWFLVSMDPKVMKIVISGLVILMVVMLARGWRLHSHVTLSVLIGAGTAGGLIQGSAGVGGPPVVAVALSRPGQSAHQRGNVLALMAAISFASLAPFLYLGLFTAKVVTIALLLLPVYLGSTWLGSLYFSGEGQRHYRLAALALLGTIAAVTLLISVRDYVQN